MYKTIFCIALLFGVVGCATMETVSNAPLTDGVSSNFPAAYDAVSGATIASLSSLNIDVKSTEQRPEGLVILVAKRLSAFSWGEVGRIFVEKSNAASTDVYVKWEKRSQLQITGTGQSEFSTALFDAIGKALQKR